MKSSLRAKLVGRGTIHRRVNGGGGRERSERGEMTPPPLSFAERFPSSSHRDGRMN